MKVSTQKAQSKGNELLNQKDATIKGGRMEVTKFINADWTGLDFFFIYILFYFFNLKRGEKEREEPTKETPPPLCAR